MYEDEYNAMLPAWLMGELFEAFTKCHDQDNRSDLSQA